MSDPTFEKAVNIRTTARAQRAINRVVADLKASDRVRWRGGEVTKEAVVNAIWLWVADLEEGVVEEAMERYVADLERHLLDRRGDPEIRPENAQAGDEAPGRGRRKRITRTGEA